MVPTDLSDAAQNAADYAAKLCSASGAGILLLHVYMLPAPVSEMPFAMISAEEIHRSNEIALQKEAERIMQHTGIDVEWAVRLGLVTDEIRDIEKDRKIDLVVLGMKVAGELEKLIGSTTISVIRKCHRAVLVIPHEVQFAPLRSVIYATDYNYKTNTACFDPLKWLTTHFNAGIQVVHVQKTDKEITPEALNGKEKLARALACSPHTYHAIKDSEIEHGLQQFIGQHAPDMLVMVAHKHNMLERLFGAHHTRTMLYHTQIPLLVLQDKE